MSLEYIVVGVEDDHDPLGGYWQLNEEHHVATRTV